jgi:KUP system potassium uptake protein
LNPALAVAALGVVFGDIGTSPLYTIKTCFTTAKVEPTLENVLGILSLLLWLLAFVVCVKYVGNLMRVDHDGEGGILALLALASPPKSFGMPLRVGWLTIVVLAGAAMLFGDGIITPAISVISAVEGIGVATKAAQPFIVPASVGILIALFLIQSRGTERVGRIFGPVMVVWFLAIGVTGLIAILRAPAVLYALDPRHAARFVTHHGIFGFLVFGAVVLAMTGVEALYADMSHFGRAPIAIAWYALVFPTLILCAHARPVPHSDGRARDARDGHCLAGAHLGCIHAYGASHQSQLVAAPHGPAHVLEPARPSLCPGRERGTWDRLCGAGAHVPQQR